MDKITSSPLDENAATMMSFRGLALLLAASAGGALAAIAVLPAWLPALNASLQGSAPQAFWFLSRASAWVAYSLLWLSMCLGLVITNKLARLWPGGPQAFDIHQHTSLLGVSFAMFHGLILLGDHYLNVTLGQVMLPFGMTTYRPIGVGMGQIGFYGMMAVAFSFYVRKQLTPRGWRLIHFLSFAVYLFALLHGIASGTDSVAGWAQGLYGGTGGIFLFLLVYRILTAIFKPVPARKVA